MLATLYRRSESTEEWGNPHELGFEPRQSGSEVPALNLVTALFLKLLTWKSTGEHVKTHIPGPHLQSVWFRSCISYLLPHNKSTQNWRLTTINIYYFQFLWISDLGTAEVLWLKVSHKAPIKMPGAAAMSRLGWGRANSVLTHVAVSRTQASAGYWLEISVPCHTCSPKGLSQHGSWLPSQQVAERENASKTVAKPFCNPIWEVISHHFSQS